MVSELIIVSAGIWGIFNVSEMLVLWIKWCLTYPAQPALSLGDLKKNYNLGWNCKSDLGHQCLGYCYIVYKHHSISLC